MPEYSAKVQNGYMEYTRPDLVDKWIGKNEGQWVRVSLGLVNKHPINNKLFTDDQRMAGCHNKFNIGGWVSQPRTRNHWMRKRAHLTELRLIAEPASLTQRFVAALALVRR